MLPNHVDKAHRHHAMFDRFVAGDALPEAQRTP